MSETEKELATWEEVIIDFFENRVSESKLYKAREYIQKKEIELDKEKDSKKIAKITEARDKKHQELVSLRNEKDGIPKWLDKISNKTLRDGKRIIKATHVLKFSHSSAPPEGLILEEKNSKRLLTTGVFKKPLTHDIAHSNGNLVTISRFFALSLNHKCIIDLVLENNFSFLNAFSKKSEPSEEWKKGLSELVEEREIKTGDKTKQFYFPTIKNPQVDKDDYDLLIPLFSSSLCEEVYTWINNIKYGNEQIEARKRIKENGASSRYFSKPIISLSGTGVQKFGGAQPQNVSMLNKSRSWKADKKDKNSYGITYLFNSAAPAWHSQIKPPIYNKSLFSDLHNASIKVEVDYLRDFLIRFKQLDISIKDPKRKRHLDRWVNNIVDEFLFYVGTIQNLPSGWAKNDEIKLKKPHQYLLDPYCLDDEFQSSRQNNDWQTIICTDFAQWLNYRLRGKDKQFTPQAEHTRLWKKMLEQPLREYMESIEQTIKESMRESV